MGYVLKAVLSSAQHPEYGQITVQLRRMGTDMVADDLRALLSEVGQTYALMAALEARRYTPTGEDLTAFRDGLAAQQGQEWPGASNPARSTISM